MNSIEKSPSPPVLHKDGDLSIPMTAAQPAPSALAAWHAVMSTFTTATPPQPTDSKTSPAALPSLLEKLLKADDLPAALAPLLAGLRAEGRQASPAGAETGASAELQSLLRSQAPSADTPPPSPDAVKAEALAGELLKLLGTAHPENGHAAVSGPAQDLQSEALLKLLGTARPENGHAAVSVPAQDLQSEAPSLGMEILRSLGHHSETTGTPPTSPPQDTTPPGAEDLANSILQSLGYNPVGSAQVQAAPAAADQGRRITEVGDLITQMADRVLVSDPLHGQTQEVRIKLADNIMEGTEVRVWREDGGTLRVEFESTSPYWSRVLNEASALLSQRLQDRLPAAAEVLVNVQQQGEQPQDGRSRNRQNPWELAQQADES